MEKYSCFCCPSKDYSQKELTDKCPNCGNTYEFPLKHYPNSISNIKIVKALSRGFYGATFVGEISPFGKRKIRKVVKVIPVELYKFHRKNFVEECDLHLEIAESSNHFVNIDTSIFHESIPVKFSNGITLDCHVIGMHYIEGNTLKDFLLKDQILPASTIAQIAIDLITILAELRKNEKYHNDLHFGNIMIEELATARKRLGEIDENVKAVAIDLGSLNQLTKSKDETDRVGDIHQVAYCLNILSRRITDNLSQYDQKEWRLAFLLEEKADFLKPDILHQKQITYENIITQIEDVIYSQTNPWSQELILRNFDDSVNAQALRPWYIPNLIVDKNDNWLNRICINGPQVITGMRGCGKTMLLRSLEFHARVVAHNDNEKNQNDLIISRLRKENYIGLYVSCMKLLDFQNDEAKGKSKIFEPYSKLLIAYSIQAIYTIRHLKDIDAKNVKKNYFNEIARVLNDFISNSETLLSVTSDVDLERALKTYLNSLSDGEQKYIIGIHPKIAFPQLAEAIKKSSELFSKANVYYLLDDVSTRYLDEENILNLVSELLFQDEICAFKFTTEAQTLEMVIMSPGKKSQAKIGRDYSVFDLGGEVNDIIHEKNLRTGKEFIQAILDKRAKYCSSHPQNIKSASILGDTSLTSIAEKIVKIGKASEKTDIYHGLSALTAVCVGDLGDVISLYEQILRKANGQRSLPIDKRKQNQCFLELCNSRLYDLNRRDTKWLKFAEGFADASHHLLLQSSVSKNSNKRQELRQYTTIFLNITAGNKNKQYKQVRELIDAGIFTFQGGPEASRTNRIGSKPQQQFKLVFRKLYGLSKHIGLSNADRFEISGEPLSDWLENPERGKEILIRNLNPLDSKELNNLIQEKYANLESIPIENKQLEMFPNEYVIEEDLTPKNKIDFSFINSKLPKIEKIELSEKSIPEFDLLIIGLGFEDATLHSAKKLSEYSYKQVIFIEFDEVGNADEIKSLFKEMPNLSLRQIRFDEFIKLPFEFTGKIICDITGLPKSVIFWIVSGALNKNSELYFSNTAPETIYPLDKEIEQVLLKKEHFDSSELLNSISKLIKGESGKYSIVRLLPSYTNFSEPRVLFAFASAKHERLYTLMDERVYDKINIVVPSGDRPKQKLAVIAAEFALRKNNNTTIHSIYQDDYTAVLNQLAKDYYTYFILNNYPFEIALTGSKMQSVCSAIFSATFKISQCWYVQPEKWDENKFSHGINDFQVHRITKK